MNKNELVTIELEKIALLLQEKDELLESIHLLKKELNKAIIEKEVGIEKYLKPLKEENASLKQELHNEKLKIEKYYQRFVNMESVYLDTIKKLKIKKSKIVQVDIPSFTINENVLKETNEYINKLNIRV